MRSLREISEALAGRDFAKLNLHLGIFEQPEKKALSTAS
jgi:hypothetical protein